MRLSDLFYTTDTRIIEPHELHEWKVNNMDQLSIRERFKISIKRKGSFKRAADKIGVSKGHLSNYLNGSEMHSDKIKLLAIYCDEKIVFPDPFFEDNLKIET